MNKKENETHNYVDFISDEHFLNCIETLYTSYKKAKQKLSKGKFYKNKIDTIKLRFDSKFNKLSEEELIKAEISRQIDKSVNNAIGSFHENILGGVEGYEMGKLSGFDIKAKDNTLFAIFGNSDISKNISDGIFEKTANAARIYTKAKLYYVLLDDLTNTNEKWVIGHEEYSVSQKRVFKISLKEFYDEITLQNEALHQLQDKLPTAVESFLSNLQPS